MITSNDAQIYHSKINLCQRISGEIQKAKHIIHEHIDPYFKIVTFNFCAEVFRSGGFKKYTSVHKKKKIPQKYTNPARFIRMLFYFLILIYFYLYRRFMCSNQNLHFCLSSNNCEIILYCFFFQLNNCCMLCFY